MKKYKWLLIPIVGNLFEWYEFAIFSSLSGIIGQLFFDAKDNLSATMFGLVVYGLAYIARPIGTLIFGYIGDKYGRKKALSLSLFLMCGSTFVIPFIPSYQDIGVFASIILIIIRVLQGISFGGEFSSVITYTCENAPVGKKGLFSAMQISCVIIAIMLGLFTIYGLHYFYTDAEILLFAWKLPFFLAIFIGILGVYVRINSSETEEFIQAKKYGKTVKNPFLYFFKNYYKEFFICSTWFLNVSMCVQAFTVGSKSVFEIIFGFSSVVATQCGIAVCVITVPFMLVAGFFGEKFSSQNVRKIYTFSALIVSIFSCYLFATQNSVSIFCGILLMSIMFGVGNGLYPYYFYKQIPVYVRGTGVGFSIAIPAIIAGGFGFFGFMKLFQIYGINGIYIFVLIANIVGFIGLFLDYKYSNKKI